jgi:hypothetical protein
MAEGAAREWQGAPSGGPPWIDLVSLRRHGTPAPHRPAARAKLACRRSHLTPHLAGIILACCRGAPRSGDATSWRGRRSVPVDTRAHRGKDRQRWLALGFAVLLAIAPFARSSLTADLALPATAVASVAAYDAGITPAKRPAAEPRPAQPLNLGILSRPSLLEAKLGLPPVKSPLMPPCAADIPLGAIQVTAGLGGDIREVLHRSSVGTARTPTGPPA